MNGDSRNSPTGPIPIETATSSRRGWLRVAGAGLLLVTISACTEGLDTNVTRFQSQLPPPAGQSFYIVPTDPALNGGIEFGQYASGVAAHLAKLGYAPAASADSATLIVHFGYGVDKGRERVQSTMIDPYFGPWHGYRGYRGWGGGWAGGGYYPRGAWGWGWYDPWFAGGVESVTVYTSNIELAIDQKNDGRHLFEGRAQAVSTSNRLPYLVPNLVEAVFTNFPGNSGETLRITVAPEKTSVHKAN